MLAVNEQLARGNWQSYIFCLLPFADCGLINTSNLAHPVLDTSFES